MTDEDFYDEFQGRGGDGEQHPAWSWKEKPKGTVFTGTIAERFKFNDKKSGRSRMGFICDTKDGRMVLFVSQWQLEKALADKRPEPGATLKIRYDGIDESDGQSKTFTVKVEAPVVAEPDDMEEPF